MRRSTVALGGLGWLLVVAVAAACGTGALRAGDRVLVESATLPSRGPDSARVHVVYSVSRSCAADVRADTELMGDTVYLALFLSESARCEGRDTTSSLDRWLPIRMMQGVRLAATQPDGSVSYWEAPAPPRRPCPGPGFAFDWGTTNQGRDYQVGQEYRLVLRRTCDEPTAIEASWTAEDTTVVALRVESDSATILIPRAPGSTRLYLESGLLTMSGGFEVVVRD